MPLHRRLMAWAVMRKMQDLSSGERRLMQGLCDVLKQLLSKPYQRHMADLLIDAASHADMVTADFARWAGRVLLILRRRPHLQSGEQGRAGTPDAGSDRRHRSHRRSSRAVGAHGRVHGYRGLRRMSVTVSSPADERKGRDWFHMGLSRCQGHDAKALSILRIILRKEVISNTIGFGKDSL